MWFTFLLVVHVLIAVTMTAIILMQQSEGGGLAGGGSPGGLMSARGATNFLTRGTAILATLFVLVSIALATIAALNRKPRTIDPSLQKSQSPIIQSTTPSNAIAPAAANVTSVPLAGSTTPVAPSPTPDAAAPKAEAPKAEPAKKQGEARAVEKAASPKLPEQPRARVIERPRVEATPVRAPAPANPVPTTVPAPTTPPPSAPQQ